MGPTAILAPASKVTTAPEWGGQADPSVKVPAPRSKKPAEGSAGGETKEKKKKKKLSKKSKKGGVTGSTAAKHTYDKGYKQWEAFDADAAEAAVSDEENTFHLHLSRPPHLALESLTHQSSFLSLFEAPIALITPRTGSEAERKHRVRATRGRGPAYKHTNTLALWRSSFQESTN